MSITILKAIFLCLCVLPERLKGFLEVVDAMGLSKPSSTMCGDGIALTPPTPITSQVPT